MRFCYFEIASLIPLLLANAAAVRLGYTAPLTEDQQRTDETLIVSVSQGEDPTESMEYDVRELTGTSTFQVDPDITRPQLVSAHTKWLFCTSAFWALTNGKCEKTQKFVPQGYFFETGRKMPDGTNCKGLTGNGDVPVVTTCRVKRGLRMVIPVVNTLYVACNEGGDIEDPRIGPAYLAGTFKKTVVYVATLDGKEIDEKSLLNVLTQDGDWDYRLPGDATCVDTFNYIPAYKGCPVGAAGPYVFLNTRKLAKGPHQLVLIGESDGLCSAVKHKFTIV
ncbi:hypothetical protein MHU86_16776 [Fragilaria crotonensis]|nr:hypothetical protein MHU86_16776 [Fragilaria crotonensis]